eukprot:TRINITY_DN19882_c0_g1_i1.p1 TRINITY_DN19882_c0_g1~~TRINITY_DN19882_c0_g1_i1.p1  ORF type:complete len:311 (-),score=118.94 TRINITY_DN19882_c0_g1_i1:243-1175(-)
MLAILNHFRNKGKDISRMLAGSKLVAAIVVLFITMIIGALVFYALEDNWSFKEAMWFTIITSTTIGYGEFAPSTTESRLFWFFYSLISLGVTGYAVSVVGDVVLSFAQARLRQAGLADNKKSFIGRYAKLIASLFSFIFILLVFAAIVQAFEKESHLDTTRAKFHTYGDTLYFMFTTLTTIGYGDIVPTTDGGRAFTSLAALLGLGVLGVLVGQLGESLIAGVVDSEDAAVRTPEERCEAAIRAVGVNFGNNSKFRSILLNVAGDLSEEGSSSSGSGSDSSAASSASGSASSSGSGSGSSSDESASDSSS